MSTRVLTANRLGDGAVVYRDLSGDWVEQLDDAAPVEGDDAGRALLRAGQADVARRLVVGPYLMDVALGAGGPMPKTQRERIRAAGPTVAAGHAEAG